MGHRGRSPDARSLSVVELSDSGPGDELTDHLAAVLDGLPEPEPVDGDLGPEEEDDLIRLLDAQMGSRWTDVAARRLHARGLGRALFSSAGHEADAAVSLAARVGDPVFPHHRSGALFLARSLQAGHRDGLVDLALGLVGSGDDPAAGGRRHLIAHPELAIVPQTSTVAGHLPRALGVAWALGRQSGLPVRLRRPLRWRDDSVVIAGFGDAAANHSTATGTINAAAWAAGRQIPVPMLFVCEDNGWGLSTRTPAGWIRSLYQDRPGLEYRYAEGTDPVATLRTAREAVRLARESQVPVLLHLSTVRLGGHTVQDREARYRSEAEIVGDVERDPLAATMRSVVGAGLLTAAELRRRWIQTRDAVGRAVGEAVLRPPSVGDDRGSVPTVPLRPGPIRDAAIAAAEDAERRRVFAEALPEDAGPLTLSQVLNRTLVDAGATSVHLVVLGQDVARRGGTDGVTDGLRRRLGASRVLDTLLDERVVLGLGLGAGLAGLLPVPEIPQQGFLRSGADQLGGEATALRFVSRGTFRNPLVLRVAGLGRPSGVGGHWPHDTALASLREIPGLVVACPSHPGDAAPMLRTCLAAAEVDGAVVVVIEPAALYHERDLWDGDGGWCVRYPAPRQWEAGHVPVGRAGTWGSGTDLTLVTYGNGLRLSLRVADRLREEGVDSRVVDLRWLNPLPIEDVVREARMSGRVLIVDEARRSAGVSEAVITELLEAGYSGRLARVVAEEGPVPPGQEFSSVPLTERDVLDGARALVRRRPAGDHGPADGKDAPTGSSDDPGGGPGEDGPSPVQEKQVPEQVQKEQSVLSG
jgi:2-oxoisovalerate dehydrogenase E1 component